MDNLNNIANGTDLIEHDGVDDIYDQFGIAYARPNPNPDPDDVDENSADVQEGSDCSSESDETSNAEADISNGAAEQSASVQSLEERHRNAERRRAQQIQDAVNAAVAVERANTEAMIAAFCEAVGLEDAKGKPVRSIAEINQFNAQQRQREFADALKAGKATPEMLQKLVSSNPDVVAAKQALQAQGTQQEQSGGNQNFDAEFDKQVKAEIAQIGMYDPAIRGTDDLKKMPNYDKFCQYVQKNDLSFIDAYRLANPDAVAAQTQRRAQQQAGINARGKQHLKSTKSVGNNSVDISDDQMDIFRSFNPGSTDDEIRQFYKNYYK